MANDEEGKREEHPLSQCASTNYPLPSTRHQVDIKLELGYVNVPDVPRLHSPLCSVYLYASLVTHDSPAAQTDVKLHDARPHARLLLHE